MSSINSVRNLQILYFSKKNEEVKKLKKTRKEWTETPIYIYYCSLHEKMYAVHKTSCMHRLLQRMI